MNDAEKSNGRSHHRLAIIKLAERLARRRFGSVYARITLGKDRNLTREKTANVSKINFNGSCRDYDPLRL